MRSDKQRNVGDSTLFKVRTGSGGHPALQWTPTAISGCAVDDDQDPVTADQPVSHGRSPIPVKVVVRSNRSHICLRIEFGGGSIGSMLGTITSAVVTRVAPHVHRGLSCPPARWCAAAKVSSETAVSNSFLLSGRGDVRPLAVDLGPLGCVFTRMGKPWSHICTHIDSVVDRDR